MNEAYHDSNYRCGRTIRLSAKCWPNDMRLSEIEQRFVCQACGSRGADVRPDYGGAKMKPRSLAK